MNADTRLTPRAIMYSALELASIKGVDLIALRLFSIHPDDYYLSIVLCRRSVCPFVDRPYCTWLLNTSATPYFASGHYDMDLADGFADFQSR